MNNLNRNRRESRIYEKGKRVIQFPFSPLNNRYNQLFITKLYRFYFCPSTKNSTVFAQFLTFERIRIRGQKSRNFLSSKHIFLPTQYDIPFSSNTLLLTISCALVTPTPTNFAKPRTPIITFTGTSSVFLNNYRQSPLRERQLLDDLS